MRARPGDLHPKTPAGAEGSSYPDQFWCSPPEPMQRSLRQRLNEHAAARWPGLADIHVRYRAGFAYVDGHLPAGDVLKLCRLRFTRRVHA